jgi:hypothetical protein
MVLIVFVHLELEGGIVAGVCWVALCFAAAYVCMVLEVLGVRNSAWCSGQE